MNQEHVKDRFYRYISCPSVSFHEKDFCLMVEEDLKALGFEVKRQEIGHLFGSDGWNIYAFLPGEGEPVLFSAHLDTMPPGENIKPVEKDGIIYSSGDTILAADDKAGVASAIEAAEIIVNSGAKHRPIEFLFMLGEEVGMLGSKNADYAMVRSRECVVLDYDDVGTMINRAPAYVQLHFEIKGKLAHAGIEPDKGNNALKAACEAISNIPCGFIGDISVQNVANLLAPGRTNAVSDTASFDTEVRSFDEAIEQRLLQEMIHQVELACSKYGTTYTVSENRVSDVLYVPEDSHLIQTLSKAMEEAGITPVVERTYGGSDATWISANGIAAVNTGVGMKDVHSTAENLAIKDLENATKILVHFMQMTD